MGFCRENGGIFFLERTHAEGIYDENSVLFSLLKRVLRDGEQIVTRAKRKR
jgi:hypothetical protein